MKISYNWLKNYLKTDLEPSKAAEILTNIGLEVEGIETFQSIKGGLEGLIIGQIKECEKHPNADKLTLTKVDIGKSAPLSIVCGAPNVKEGQKVVVAPVGTTLHHVNGETLQIKKAKIREEVSEGMICAEDEIGLGITHDGILVLEDDAKPGTLAKEYFDIEEDTIFEIGLTPNRIDAGAHFGVARDLRAYLNQEKEIDLTLPDITDFNVDNNNYPVEIVIENTEACPRYCGITLSGITVKPSPPWLQTRLKSIGMKPINNIVDITNFVLHELGQPLHAFDADKIKGKKVIIKTVAKGTKFITLDEVTRTLSDEDLMICDTEKPMCIGGVFGGINTGVTEKTKNIFLESAYFNPVWIRKTAKYHGLNTDASFHFERGTDPNLTDFALKRAILLMKEIAGGTISSGIVDVYPKKIEDFKVKLSFHNLTRLVGKEMDKKKVMHILSSLEIKILDHKKESLLLSVPPYRVDVTREADVIEEILRIYGYNNIEFSHQLLSCITPSKKPDKDKITNIISDFISSNGFNEIMSNSLTKSEYYNNLNTYKTSNLVKLYNPLSSDLNCMRQTLLFGGLEAIAYNINRQNSNCKLYEFGNCYFFRKNPDSSDFLSHYHEKETIGIFLTGDICEENWMNDSKSVDLYYLKGILHTLIKRLGINKDQWNSNEIKNELFREGLEYYTNNTLLIEYGSVSETILKKFDIETDVYFAEINWSELFRFISQDAKTYKPIIKYPEVKRDLSMLLDRNVKFEQIEKLAFEVEKNYLKQINLFDVYEGDQIAKGKKSYAVSFILQDKNDTMKDTKIDKIMVNLANALKKELGAQIRE